MIALQSSKLVAVTKIINPSAEGLSLTTFEVCSSKFEVCSSDISWPRARPTSQNSATRRMRLPQPAVLKSDRAKVDHMVRHVKGKCDQCQYTNYQPEALGSESTGWIEDSPPRHWMSP